jgi:PEP-CTERM motif
MKHIVRFLSLAVLLAVSARGANADTINGTLGILSDPANNALSSTGIAFNSTTSTADNGTGDLTTFGGNVATFFNITFASLSGGEELFTVTNSALTETLVFTAFSFNSLTPGVDGSVMLAGTLAETGTVNGSNNAVVLLTNATVPSSNTDVQVATFVPTPEPSSLVLLGTGLLGAAGMLLRRRRQTAAGLGTF